MKKKGFVITDSEPYLISKLSKCYSQQLHLLPCGLVKIYNLHMYRMLLLFSSSSEASTNAIDYYLWKIFAKRFFGNLTKALFQRLKDR